MMGSETLLPPEVLSPIRRKNADQRRELHRRIYTGEADLEKVFNAARKVRDEVRAYDRQFHRQLPMEPKVRVLYTAKAQSIVAARMAGIHQNKLGRTGQPVGYPVKIARSFLIAAGVPPKRIDGPASSYTAEEVQRIMWLCQAEPLDIPLGWPVVGKPIEDVEWKIRVWTGLEERDIRWLANKELTKAYRRSHRNSKTSG